jgi:predicted MFS family arabinose efflux permease
MSEAAGRPRVWATLAVLAAINLINYADRYVLGGALPLVQRELGSSDALMGALSAAFLAVFSIFSPITGLLGDRYPRRWFIGAGVLLWSGATLWSASAGSYGELLAARALIGVGEAGYGAMAPGYIADLFEPHRRGTPLAIFSAAIPLGVGIGYAIGGAVGEAHGWRTAFLIAGIPGLLLGAVALLLPEPERGGRERVRRDLASVPSVKEIARTLLRRKSYLINTAGYTAMSFATGALGAWMPTFLHRVRGLPLGEATTRFGGMMVVVGFGATLLGGSIGDRFQRTSRGGHLAFSGAVLLVAAPWTLLAVTSTLPLLYWAGIAGTLFFLFLNTAPLQVSLLQVTPPEMRATGVAVNVLVSHLLGDALAPPVIGAISDATSLTLGLVVTAAVLAGAGLILVLGRGALRADLDAIEPRTA